MSNCSISTKHKVLLDPVKQQISSRSPSKNTETKREIRVTSDESEMKYFYAFENSGELPLG